MARNPGRLLKHKDGRIGVAYNKDQAGVPQGKLKVVWMSDQFTMKPIGEATVVSTDNLKLIGMVD